jgi:hypothetical protein
MAKIIIGLEGLEKKFKIIDKRIDKRVLLPAVRAGLKPIKKQARRNAKWASVRKLLSSRAFIAKSKNIIGKVFVRPSKDRTIIVDGRRVGFEVAANILEFGRAAAGDAGGAKAVPPKSFLRSARDQKHNEAMREVRRVLKQRLQLL